MSKPDDPHSDPLRRLICHPWFPPACILIALVLAAANQWAAS